jgi:hypothetical protein
MCATLCLTNQKYQENLEQNAGHQFSFICRIFIASAVPTLAHASGEQYWQRKF